MRNSFLVTGATGFVGSNIVRELVKRRQSVSIIVRNKALNWRLKDIADKIHIYECDLLSPNLDKVIFRIKPTIIFHLASYGALPHENNIQNLLDVNFKAGINLIQAVKRFPFKLFINTGSSSEYGIKKSSMKESDILEPINDYGICKSAFTLYCQKTSKHDRLPIVTYRLFSPFGPYESKERFVPTVISNMIQNTSFELSSPSYVRDFIYIQDVVNAYVDASDKVIPFGSIINIGSGKQRTLQDVVKITQKITGSNSCITWNPGKTQSRQIESKYWRANIYLAQKILHWRCAYSFNDGIQATIEWMNTHKQQYT